MYKINSLNLLKILLAFNIFLIHAQEVGLWPHFAWPDGSSAFFFVLSGFGLATGYGHQVATSWNNRRFMISRLWRFYPLHFVTLVLCVVLMWWSGTPYGIKPLACNTLLLQSWIPNPIYYFSGNGVSWFLSSLFFCYAIFGWLYRLLMHTSTTKMWLRYGAMVGIYLIVMAICPAGYENSLLYIHPLARVPNFAMGIIAFRLCTKIDTHHQFRWSMQVVLVALASLIVVLWLAGWRMPFVVRCSSWWWLVSCLTIVCLYASEAHFPAMRRFFNHKIFSSLGSLSFTFYMWHQVCIRVYTTLESKHLVEMNHYAAMALLLAIVLLLSWTSNKYFTRPLVKRFAPSTRR